MAEPLAEALKGIETVVLLVRVTVLSVGVDGAVAAKGVIELEAEDAVDVPAALMAAIVNVYAWP